MFNIYFHDDYDVKDLFVSLFSFLFIYLFILLLLMFKIFFWLYWGLNSGICACLASALPTEACLLFFFLAIFWMGSCVFLQGQSQTPIFLCIPPE
jgi:hypothetical protein